MEVGVNLGGWWMMIGVDLGEARGTCREGIWKELRV